MRIITWNVNSLKSILPFRPWNELQNKSIEGMLDAMEAEIVCLQEHKMRRDQLTRPYVLPSTSYDSFFSFPSWKQGYSGTCIYVKNTYAVPIKAEEGITGLLLDVIGSTSGGGRSASVAGTSAGAAAAGGGGATVAGWRIEEKIGGYVGEDEMVGGVEDEVDGKEFDMKKLDMEGRAVVLDFGFFVIFNLYCPNETNDSRLPYKLNYLRHLQSRVDRLVSSGRNVIVLGDMNVCHRPLDNGEGGIQRNADEHFDHPARKWFDAWLAPRGMMHDVTRDIWPERKGMFTCWNTKLDARPSNYGARIDYILVTPGLLPWIKNSDIQPDVMGSDHCPVYLDLHEEITLSDGTVLRLRDLMNPSPRISLPPALQALEDLERSVPEPPSFATKWWDEFSGKQRSLKDFFGKKGDAPPPSRLPRNRSSSLKPTGAPAAPFDTVANEPGPSGHQAAIASDRSTPDQRECVEANAPTGYAFRIQYDETDPTTSSAHRQEEACIDLTAEVAESSSMARARVAARPGAAAKNGTKGKPVAAKNSKDSQMKLSTFFRPPPLPTATMVTPATIKRRKTSTSPEPVLSAGAPLSMAPLAPYRSQASNIEESDYLYAVALAEQEEAMEEDEDAARAEAIDQAGVVSTWGNIFAKKVPPKCRVHGVPCKPFVTKISGKNKGKKFWLCSKPLGEGWDNGKSKRPRDEVNHQFRCDYFIWDHAVKEREALKLGESDVNAEGTPSKKRKAVKDG